MKDIKKETLKKIDGMEKDIIDFITSESKRLLNSGAIDLEKYDPEEYALAKIILHVALMNASEQYAPLYGDYKNEIRNLEHF